MPDSSTFLHNTVRVTGLPAASTVPMTMALGSATPARSASASHARNSATQPSVSQFASRSGLPSFSADPYSTLIAAKRSWSGSVTRHTLRLATGSIRQRIRPDHPHEILPREHRIEAGENVVVHGAEGGVRAGCPSLRLRPPEPGTELIARQ